MATALTVLYSAQVATTLTTANQLYIATATPANTQTFTQLDASTGYGEVCSQGTASAWSALSNIGSPSGKGFLLENAILALAGNQINAGSWSAAIRLNSQQGQSFQGNIFVRAWKYNSVSLTYTLIISMSLTGQSFTGTITTYNLTGNAGVAAFGTNDLLYTDAFLQVTANQGSSGQQIRLNRLSTATVAKNGDANAQIVTPGYQTTVVATGSGLVSGGMLGFLPQHGGSL